METKYEVIPLFPTPLYINEIPKQLVEDHISLLDSEKILQKEESTSSGNISLDTFILDKPEYKNLNQYIIQHGINYAENFMSYDYKDYKFSQSWISIKNPNESHHAHLHSFSLISGVLFYGEFYNDTSNLTFLRSDDYTTNSTPHLKKSQENLNGFSSTSFSLYYKSNTLVLFPSYLKHEVSKNITNIPLKSLAFNIVPKEGFGEEKSLNRLKFN
jgi:uncharacterized protein (TIGR02466 family)